jgi:Spy/CpxP family protein refolding chaperone
MWITKSTGHASFGREESSVSLTRFVTGAALVAALAAPLAASAQSAPPPAPSPSAGPHGDWHGGRPRHHSHRNPYLHALRSLNLNDAQKQQVRTAFQQMREADRAAMRANAEKLRGQIDAILTPAQRTQLRTTLEQERMRHQRRDEGAPQATPPAPAAP